MSINKILTLALIIPCFVACRPKPIDIEVPQAPPAITISSIAFDEHTVFVSAGYSINSCVGLNDTAASDSRTKSGIPREMLVSGGLVTITEEGTLPDTLTEISTGLYASRKLHLKQGVQYTLMVKDLTKNVAATAQTIFFAKPAVDNAEQKIEMEGADTITKLHLQMSNVAQGDKYFVTYSTTAQVHNSLSTAIDKLPTIYNFSPKTLELLTGEDVVNGKLDKTISMKVNANDTLVVQVARIDNAYYQYLSAYKRSGFLINQLTGEPINLPTNITTGFGFFSLCQSDKMVFVAGKRIAL